MAEAISLTIGGPSLTSLFSTCVECFGYFSASKDFERDRNILLKSRKQLGCVISILIDAKKLHDKYGVKRSEGQRKGSTSWSVVSKNNLDLFKPTLKRFLLRNPEEAANYRKYKVLTKLRWAIHDKQKFQGLINDLKELVEQLFLIQFNSKLLVNPSQLNESMKVDIELIDNVEQLSLIQEACKDSYQAWSDHAGSVIAASEKGTTDRRTFEEVSRDIYNGDSEIATQTPTVEREKSALQYLVYLRDAHKLHVVLTDECFLHSEKKLCDVGASLGTDALLDRSFVMPTAGGREWEKTASPTHVLKPEISRLLRQALQNEENPRSRRLCELVLAEKLTDNQEQFLSILFPLVKIQLYVAPCTCLLTTAIEMCSNLWTPYVQAIIRPDYRLRSTCCSGQNGPQRMREIADRIRGAHGFEPEGYDREYLYQFDNIDLTWVENMIFMHDERQTEQSASFSSANEPFILDYRDTSTCDLLILIGEARVLGPEMVKRPFKHRVRVPKQSEIYVLDHNHYPCPDDESLVWRFKGRFTPQSNDQ
ncbi:MAG: hypothetical protein M1839_003164 [Geoglossum umbratile]|nr:MAG: hypothetical protein M1839_003164 [Geoglossum umbratile]